MTAVTVLACGWYPGNESNNHIVHDGPYGWEDQMMEVNADIREIHHRWRRRELLCYRAKIIGGLLTFVALVWLTIVVFGK